jgi:hypothetical protein
MLSWIECDHSLRPVVASSRPRKYDMLYGVLALRAAGEKDNPAARAGAGPSWWPESESPSVWRRTVQILDSEMITVEQFWVSSRPCHLSFKLPLGAVPRPSRMFLFQAS